MLSYHPAGWTGGGPRLVTRVPLVLAPRQLHSVPRVSSPGRCPGHPLRLSLLSGESARQVPGSGPVVHLPSLCSWAASLAGSLLSQRQRSRGLLDRKWPVGELGRPGIPHKPSWLWEAPVSLHDCQVSRGAAFPAPWKRVTSQKSPPPAGRVFPGNELTSEKPRRLVSAQRGSPEAGAPGHGLRHPACAVLADPTPKGGEVSPAPESGFFFPGNVPADL